jgi:hypothetical protein
MHIPGLAHEYERTCDECGHAWGVPKWAVHPHMLGLPMGARSGVGGGLRATDAVVSANAELAERADAYARCPECGCDHYKQRAIRS